MKYPQHLTLCAGCQGNYGTAWSLFQVFQHPDFYKERTHLRGPVCMVARQFQHPRLSRSVCSVCAAQQCHGAGPSVMIKLTDNGQASTSLEPVVALRGQAAILWSCLKPLTSTVWIKVEGTWGGSWNLNSFVYFLKLLRKMFQSSDSRKPMSFAASSDWPRERSP